MSAAQGGVGARLAQLTKLTAGYGLMSLVGPIFTVLLTPLYTRVLRPADYAVLDTLTTLGGLAQALATVGLSIAMPVIFYDGGDGHRRDVIATAAAIGSASGLLLAAALALAAPPLAAAALSGPADVGLVLILAANVPFAVQVAVVQTALRLRMAVRRTNGLALGNLLATVALNVALVLALRLGVWGVQATALVATAGTALAGALLLRREGWGRPRAALVWPLVRGGLPIVPGALALWALNYADRLILPAFGVPLDQRGLYAIAAKLASMLSLVVVPFQNAWGPLALSMRDAPEAERTYVKVLTYFAAGGLGLALALSLFAREILLVFTTPAYAGAAPFVAPLAYVAVASGAGVAAGVGAGLARRTDINGWAMLAGAALNLLLNALLVPRLGVWGAAWATALGYAALPAVLYLGSQRVRPLPFELGKVLAALAAQAALLAAGLLAGGAGWGGLLLRAALLAAYPAALLALRVVTPGELRALAALARRGGAG